MFIFWKLHGYPKGKARSNYTKEHDIEVKAKDHQNTKGYENSQKSSRIRNKEQGYLQNNQKSNEQNDNSKSLPINDYFKYK